LRQLIEDARPIGAGCHHDCRLNLALRHVLQSRLRG
jgi:hypothetical protein